MSRASIDDLGELQRAVMEVVWALGEATVQQVRGRLGREPEPAYTTVLSVMQKLEKAGWLSHRADGRIYVYVPTRTRDEAKAVTLRRFIDRVFRGDRLRLFRRLLDDQELTDAELAEIREMIDRRRREATGA